MKRVMKAALALGVIVLATSMVSAQAPAGRQGGGRQGGAAPAPLKNVKVFKKGSTMADVLPTMRAFEGALGVECGYCHVWYGNGNANNDFASDLKPQKDIARAMVRMVNLANEQIEAGVTQTGARTDVQKVTCATCHRGKPIPQVEQYQQPAAGQGAKPPVDNPPAGGAR
jgi:hypothetical protein